MDDDFLIMIGGKILCKQRRFSSISSEVCCYKHKYSKECFHQVVLTLRSSGKKKSSLSLVPAIYRIMLDMLMQVDTES